MTSAFPRRGASSPPDARRRPAARPAVLSPYAGAKDSRRLRLARGLILPLLAVFGLANGTVFAIVAPFMMAFFPIPIAILGMIAIWGAPGHRQSPDPGPELPALRLYSGAHSLAQLSRHRPARLALDHDDQAFRLPPRGGAADLPVGLRALPGGAVADAAGVPGALETDRRLLGRGVPDDRLLQGPGVFATARRGQEVDWTALFFVACSVFLKPRRADAWAILFSATTVPIALIALREYQMGQLPWADHIPSFLQVQDESVNRILAGAHREEGEYRVQSTFSTPLGLAEYIALALPFLIHYMTTDRFAIWIRVAIAGLIYLLINIVLMTDARLGLIGCFLSGLLSLLFWAIQRWRRSQPSVFGPAVTLSYPIIAAMAYASTLFVGRIREKVWGSGQYDDSTEARKQMYNQGIPMILNHPQGYGSGMGAEQLGFRNAAGVLTIDTYYLAIGLDYGVLGFLIYYCAFLLAAGKSTQAALTFETSDHDIALLAPIAISLVNYIVIKSVFSNEENHPLVFIMAGMALAMMSRIQRQAKPAERSAGSSPEAEAAMVN